MPDYDNPQNHKFTLCMPKKPYALFVPVFLDESHEILHLGNFLRLNGWNYDKKGGDNVEKK